MTAASALDWFREMLWTAVLVAGPAVLSIVVVGLILAILQAATQVNDQAVAFAPKAIAAVAALSLSGPWMLGQLSGFVESILLALAQVHP
ncbi:MAG: flagellar biosynthetic protein FliQ [Myxococcales bacterium]|nr:flagellar biosynthetic protein FliQ [Myxococcales bacterium]